MSVQQRPLINLPGWTPSATDAVEPSGSKKASGWTIPTEKPDRGEVNWLFKSISAIIAWLFGTDEDQYWVDADAGNDANTGASDVTALKTIDAALAKMRPGHPTKIWLSSDAHHITAHRSLNFPQLTFIQYEAGYASIVFDYYVPLMTTTLALYSITNVGGYINLSGIDCAIPAIVAPHTAYDWSAIYTAGFIAKGVGAFLMDAGSFDVGTASSGTGKPSLFKAASGGFCSATFANVPAGELATLGRAYLLDITDAGGALLGDPNDLAAAIDNQSYLVQGATDLTLREVQEVKFMPVPNGGTFALLFGSDVAEAAIYKIVTGTIAYNRDTDAHVWDDIDAVLSAYDVLVDRVNSSVTRSATAITKITLVLTSSSSVFGVGNVRGLKVNADITSLGFTGGGAGKTISRVTTYGQTRYHSNLVTTMNLPNPMVVI